MILVSCVYIDIVTIHIVHHIFPVHDVNALRWLRTIVVWLPIKAIKDVAVSQLLATN